jgi:hypothetical protein
VRPESYRQTAMSCYSGYCGAGLTSRPNEVHNSTREVAFQPCLVRSCKFDPGQTTLLELWADYVPLTRRADFGKGLGGRYGPRRPRPILSEILNAASYD